MPDLKNKLREVINNPASSADEKEAAWKQIESLEETTDSEDGEGSSVQVPARDSEENHAIESGAVKAMVLMGLCDQEQTRLGREAFDYDPEVKAVCGLWLEARKRASGVPLFKQLFDRVLTQNDRMILGLDEK